MQLSLLAAVHFECVEHLLAFEAVERVVHHRTRATRDFADDDSAIVKRAYDPRLLADFPQTTELRPQYLVVRQTRRRQQLVVMIVLLDSDVWPMHNRHRRVLHDLELASVRFP